MKRRRKRKGRIRWKRVFIVLFIIVFIVATIKITNYIRYNNKVYDTVVDSSAKNALINRKYKKLKLYNKTIDLIKSDDVSIVIQDKKSKVYLDSKNVKKNMNIVVKTYNKRLKYEGFPRAKAYFIENNNIVKKSTKVELKLPGYLTKNGIVDVYGVRKDGKVNQVSLADKIKDTVTIKTTDKYERYFVTYIKLEDIKIKSSTVNKGSVVNLNIKYIPETATVKEYKYTNIGDIFMLDKHKIVAKKAGTGKISIKHTVQNIKKTATITVKEEENKIEVINGITYVNKILIANKTYGLPKNYNPGEISKEAKEAFERMRKDAAKDGITLWIQSGYRSYETQEKLYNNYVKQSGQTKADTFSARPGHSEHQTGLTADINSADESFEGTPEAIWLDENCYKYGFIVRYPKGKEKYTGYEYEPWHLRYIGKEKAKKLYESGLSLEEYYNIKSEYVD